MRRFWKQALKLSFFIAVYHTGDLTVVNLVFNDGLTKDPISYYMEIDES
jgi:hypothetical protein